MSFLLRTCILCYRRSITSLFIRKSFRQLFVSQNLLISDDQQVRVISEDGISLGLMSKVDAESKAKELNVKLIQVAKSSEKVEYSVFKFISKVKKNHQTSQKVNSTVKTKEKELTMKSQIESQDLDVKARKLQSFIDKGYQVTIKISKPRRSNILPRETYDSLISRINGDIKLAGTAKESKTFLRCIIKPDTKL